LGMAEATIDDLVFPNQNSRESDRIGPEDCLRKLRPSDSKTRNFCPSEAKDARFQASLSSPSRRVTMPAQPSNGFFRLLAFAYALKKLMRKWREKSEGSKAIPKSIFETL